LSKKGDRLQRVFELIKQAKAAEERKARKDSQARGEEIKVQWDLKEQDLKAETTKERKLKAQKLKKQKLKEILDSVRNLAADLIEPEKGDLIDRVNELVELVGLQDREIEYLTEFERKWEQILAYDREGLENLEIKSWRALHPFSCELASAETPQARYERKRRRYTWAGVGKIEREFGDPRAALWQTNPILAPLIAGPPPTCLDEILTGGGVNMVTLQELFGIDRHRLGAAAGVEIKKGRLYYYSTVMKIFGFLLSESERPNRKGPGAPKVHWLSERDVRTRVLEGIESRIAQIAKELPRSDRDKALWWWKEIATPFLDIVRRYRGAPRIGK